MTATLAPAPVAAADPFSPPGGDPLGWAGFNGVWRSLVARFVRDEEVVGSNPATPTVK